LGCKRDLHDGAAYICGYRTFTALILNYIAVGLRMMPNKNTMTAISSKTWMMLPAVVKKKVTAHPATSIKAITYSSELMIISVILLKNIKSAKMFCLFSLKERNLINYYP
jgi:hypothetical protein